MNLSMRKHYIDNLRWIILLILIPYHAAQAWNTWGEPNYIYFDENRWISSIIVFVSPYFMPLLFVLAGVSTKYALQKRSNKEYLVERVKRLFIPFLFGTIVLMPIMAYLADRFNYSYSGGFVEHYAIFFTKYTDLIGADGGFSLGQFWFLLYLLIVSVIGVGVITLSKRIVLKSEITIPFWIVCLLGLPLPLLSELLSIGGKSLVEYMYLFMLGYYVFTDEKIIDKAEKNCWLLFGIGLVATILNTYLFIWADKEVVLINTDTKYVSEWIMIIALIGLAKKYLNFTGNVSSYMNKRSFLFYIYHFIWVVLFQYILYGVVGDHSFVLFMGTVLLAYGATFICCEISIRIPFMCFLTGIKYSPKK
ncbi:MAG: acyltransferase family protein [Lachnospiraceae bacterium]|nr:acyltransferase family protein [Lachnospiraceae bacterium]